jgi:hypothetical protein
MGEEKNACRILLRKSDGKRLRNKHSWENNIKMDLREMGWSGMHWIDLAHNRDRWRALVNTVMNFRVP